MREFTITDDFGRRTTFKGEKLVNESTDTLSGIKPLWLDVEVWRTQAGSFVARRTAHYRIRHASDRCPRGEGYELIPSTQLDTYPCGVCNKTEQPGGFGQADRITVDAYTEPQELIDSFRMDGRYSNLARTILADIAEQDDRIDAIWNTVVVP